MVGFEGEGYEEEVCGSGGGVVPEVEGADEGVAEEFEVRVMPGIYMRVSIHQYENTTRGYVDDTDHFLKTLIVWVSSGFPPNCFFASTEVLQGLC